ncbi:nitrite reductase large subunit NirB [Streptomyces huiliensis]|uniref:nitrite reductase large subunit NirB n=1 Tax=Streptomyces huiliensis TaxID=2876027 RepID=UPI001CBC0FF5|nr:nitrite reductase large subunit NirB [Streptomyces huiliensis]MBZ4323237.1 nitrite reductase large subunit NirB [Streptomyces huiliensis]
MTTPSTTPPHLVLIGHGMVGQRFLEALARRADGLGADAAHAAPRVTVLAEEPRPAYDRVRLTSYLTGVTEAELSLWPQEFAERPGVELHLGDPVTAVDRTARKVTTRSGAVHAYDTLVLATGSRPFVPPVTGRDTPGCFVYRTLDDLDALRARAGAVRTGLVVGGGLLGLEAAGALRALGLETHVVEFTPRLMAAQVDDGGGAALRRKIEELGVVVHTGVGAQAVEAGPDGTVASVTLSDGTVVPCGLVVFSAGVRPRDELARACGLPVGERGGIVVDEGCRTADPRVWAVGECALTADGRVHGLVAPGYAMAEAAADRITGGDGSFTGAEPAARLKLLGVAVASFGDAHATGDDALEVSYANSRDGVYKKLVVTPDGRLLGGVLVGDTDAYDVLRPLAEAGTPLTTPPERLLLPASAAGAAAPGPESLPDSTIVCSCHNVTKGCIRAAVTEHGCADVRAVQRQTHAGTGCGSCVSMLTKLVDAETTLAGATPAPRGLCEHFSHTRAELFDIISVTGITSFSRLIDEHGSDAHGSDGCDTCKPVVASILATLNPHLGNSVHILDGEQAALQDTNDHFLANLQRNGSYSVVPRVPAGEITPEKLIVLGEVARDFGLYTKITGGQRIDLLGATVDQLPRIWRRLVDAGFESGHAYGKALRTVKSCVGSLWCRYGVQDSVALAVELELRYRGLRSPHKLKAAVSGCARECAEARGKDFGVIATAAGWNLYVGGNGGTTPRHAELLLADADRDTLVRTLDRFLMFYIRTADRLERTAPWIARMEGGLDRLRSVLVDDSLGICADLDALMAQHVATYEDEWRATLDDPERLRRFVSFVNAPGTPDPAVRFEGEPGRIRPADPPVLPLPVVGAAEPVAVVTR